MTTANLICEHCGKVIGVYEPTVLISGGEVSETSRAAAPAIVSAPGLKYHRDCYRERLQSGRELRDSA